MASEMLIGVLALQGAFAKHIEMIQGLGVQAKEIRKPHELAECDALIIPGGESTTMLRQVEFIGLREALLDFVRHKAVFGTCAGLILLSKQIVESPMTPFGVMDIVIERNAFGRQIESFKMDVEICLGKEKPRPYEAVFIRAPRIKECSPNVKVLSRCNEEPILVQQGHYLGSTFHPELTNDPLIHRHFLTLVKR